MKLIKYSIHSGAENMQIDSDMLDDAILNHTAEPIFRLYGWNPKCISFGRNQNADFYKGDVDSVRRLTGGRALLHDNEVTYSCVCPISYIPDGEIIIQSYKYISGILIKFFQTIGVKLDYGENKKVSTHFDYCMLLSTGADVCYNNKKLIGSAQYRKNGYILQHGSILFDYNKDLLEALFNEKIENITAVKEILPNISKIEFISKLEDYLTNL